MWITKNFHSAHVTWILSFSQRNILSPLTEIYPQIKLSSLFASAILRWQGSPFHTVVITFPHIAHILMHAAHALLTLACYFDSWSQRVSRPVATSSDTTSWIEKPARVVAWSWLTLQLTRKIGYVTLSRKNRKKWITFPFCTNLKCKLQTCQMKK